MALFNSSFVPWSYLCYQSPPFHHSANLLINPYLHTGIWVYVSVPMGFFGSTTTLLSTFEALYFRTSASVRLRDLRFSLNGPLRATNLRFCTFLHVRLCASDLLHFGVFVLWCLSPYGTICFSYTLLIFRISAYPFYRVLTFLCLHDITPIRLHTYVAVCFNIELALRSTKSSFITLLPVYSHRYVMKANLLRWLKTAVLYCSTIPRASRF